MCLNRLRAGALLKMPKSDYSGYSSASRQTLALKDEELKDGFWFWLDERSIAIYRQSPIFSLVTKNIF